MSWADCQNILSWTQYSETTTLIYMMDVRSKWIQPWSFFFFFFYQLWIHAWGSLSGARDDVDTGSHCLSRFNIPPPLATRLKLVICCLAACCQYARDSRFNICGLLTGLNAIRLFGGCKASLCTHHAIYHFNGPQLSQETRFNLVTTLVCSLC